LIVVNVFTRRLGGDVHTCYRYVGRMLLQAYTVDEPMVAFVCNRPAMHSTDHGWVSDDSANCMNDPVDVLNYCRKVCRLYEYTLQSLTIIIN